MQKGTAGSWRVPENTVSQNHLIVDCFQDCPGSSILRRLWAVFACYTFCLSAILLWSFRHWVIWGWNISPDLFGRCKLIAHTLDHAVCNSNLGNWCRLLEILRWEYGEKWKCIWQFPSKTSNNKQNHLTQKDGVYDSPMSFAAFSFMTAVMAESWLCSLRWWTQTCFCLRNLGMETGGKNANVVLQGCSCYSRFQIECSWALKHWVLQWEIKDSDSRWQLGVDCSSRDRGRRFWKFNMAQCRLQPKSIQSCATVSTSKAKRLNLMFVYLNLT